jgi:hypothetical protein
LRLELIFLRALDIQIVKDVHLKTGRSIADTAERESANFGVVRTASLSVRSACVFTTARV